MLYLLAIMIFFTVFTFILGSYRILFRERLLVTERLSSLSEKKVKNVREEDELNKPFFERVVKPLLEMMANKFFKFMPTGKKINLNNKLLMAGSPSNLTANEFLAFQYALAIGFPILIILFTFSLGWSFTRILIVSGIAVIVGYILPEYYLKVKTSSRQDEILKSLPDILDLLTVSVEAGLGFDAALVKVVEKTNGVLSNEFARVLQEIKMGKPRRDALRDLGQRSGVEELLTFIGAIIQADQLGVSIGNVLRLQSEQMRQKRKNRIEEKAMKAPVKMLIPLILFIFPTIFIVILGPALIQVMKALAK